MAKRFYKVNEKVWVKNEKREGKILELDIPNLTATVSFQRDESELVTRKMKFMDIDKLRTATDSLTKILANAKPQIDTILVAKVHEGATIPTKNFEDAGYDFYACLDEDNVRIQKGKPTLIPTGIATSMLPKYWLNLKHERGISGMQGMAILSGVVDSGYRGEIFINITPLYKDIVISKTFEFPVKNGKIKPVETDDEIIFPYSVAIAQGTIELVPVVKWKEISYDQLKAIPSKRGDSKLGESGK